MPNCLIQHSWIAAYNQAEITFKNILYFYSFINIQDHTWITRYFSGTSPCIVEIPVSSFWATISPQQQHWCKSLSTSMKEMALLKFYTGTIFLNIFFCGWCFVFMKHWIKCINTKFNEFCILKCCKWELNTMPQMFLLCLSPKGPSVQAWRSVTLSMHSSHFGGDSQAELNSSEGVFWRK